MKQLIILKESDDKIQNANNLFDKIKKINVDYTQENVIVFYLNTRNEVINSEVLFKGGLNSCILDPKTTFRKALINNANSIIIAHNHPSGDLKPSKEDINIYKDFEKIGDIISISVLDSIIFNKKEYYALKEVV